MPVSAAEVLRAFLGARLVSEPQPIGASLTELFLNRNKRGDAVIITLTRVAREPKEYQGRKTWGVQTVQHGTQQWVNLECDFAPTPGMEFDVQLKSKPRKDGGQFIDAQIIGPARPREAAAKAEAAADADTKGTAAVPTRIAWADWVRTIQASADAALAAGVPSEHIVGVIQSSLVAVKESRLEPPPLADAAPAGDEDWPG